MSGLYWSHLHCLQKSFHLNPILFISVIKSILVTHFEVTPFFYLLTNLYIFWFQSLKSYFRFLYVFYEKQNKKNILGIQYYHCDNKANKQNDVNMQWKPVHPGFNNSQGTFGFYMLYMERRTYYFVNTRCISLVYYITLLTTNWQTNKTRC